MTVATNMVILVVPTHTASAMPRMPVAFQLIFHNKPRPKPFFVVSALCEHMLHGSSSAHRFPGAFTSASSCTVSPLEMVEGDASRVSVSSRILGGTGGSPFRDDVGLIIPQARSKVTCSTNQQPLGDVRDPYNRESSKHPAAAQTRHPNRASLEPFEEDELSELPRFNKT